MLFYIEWPDASEAVDIKMLNMEIARSAVRQAKLRGIGADMQRNET
jgi:hypothetical protein